MSEYMKDFMREIIPAILAGVLAGLGAYTAVKVDVAVVMSNQVIMKEDLKVVKDVSERQVRQESKMEFFQYQLDALREEAKEGKYRFSNTSK